MSGGACWLTPWPAGTSTGGFILRCISRVSGGAFTSGRDELGEFKDLEKATKSLRQLSQVAKVRRQGAKVFHAIKTRSACDQQGLSDCLLFHIH